MSSEGHEVYHPSLNRSILAVVDETKLIHTKLYIGLQGFVLLRSATCFYDKKLAQEDKNHLALMLCYRSLIPSK